MRLSDTPVIFLDCQTTGANPDHSHLLEVGWMVDVTGGPLQGACSTQDSKTMTSHVLALPEGEAIPPGIQRLTGIRPDDLEGSISPEDLYGMLKALEPRFCVIHYASFETRFLMPFFEKHGGSAELPWTVICTNQLSRHLLPELPSRSLRALAGYFGLHLGQLKRAEHHVHGTRCIWTGLVGLLKKRNITTFEQLFHWMSNLGRAKKSAKKYPLNRQLRLGLPDRPGVYHMLSHSGQVLYVGKATSLKSRVNSYFRSQRGHSSSKFEMLTQVSDVRVTVCDSPLEAALLETDEIKALNPPYNVVLKEGDRRLGFFEHNYLYVQDTADGVFCYGPFPRPEALIQLQLIHFFMVDQVYAEELFYHSVPPSLFEEGLGLFFSWYGLLPHHLRTMRQLLALGVRLSRLHENRSSEGADGDSDPELSDGAQDELEEDQEAEVTAEHVARRIERIFVHCGRVYRRSRLLGALLDCSVFWRRNGRHGWNFLQLVAGAVAGKGRLPRSSTMDDLVAHGRDEISTKSAWDGCGIDVYDRLRVLVTELGLLKGQGYDIVIVRDGRPCVIESGHRLIECCLKK